MTKRGPCPVCNRGTKDRALAITSDEHGSVSYCHRCGFTESSNHRRPGIPIGPKTYRPWVGLAEYLWESSEPLQGSLAATYLQKRGCRLPPSDGDSALPAGARGSHRRDAGACDRCGHCGANQPALHAPQSGCNEGRRKAEATARRTPQERWRHSSVER